MVPLTQTRTGDNGNCFATALASIFETDIPEFGQGDGPEYWDNVDRWLSQRGYAYRQVPVDAPAPVGYHTIEGLSPRGGMHAIVGKDGKPVHDPHPQDGTGRGLAALRTWGVLLPIKNRMERLYDRRPNLRSTKDQQPFYIQVTEPSGKEHTVPVSQAARTYDRAQLHRALDAALDRARARDAYNTKVTKTFTVTCGEDFMARFEQFLAFVVSLGSVGHSAWAGLSVDGDGSDRMDVAESLPSIKTLKVTNHGTYPDQFEAVSKGKE